MCHSTAIGSCTGNVHAVVAAVRLTIDNDQLQAELERQLTEVAASRNRIVEAGDVRGAMKHAKASAISVRVTGDGQIMHVADRYR